MHKLVIAASLVTAATSAALAPGQGYDAPGGHGRDFRTGIVLINAPGGAYIQCDPRIKSSPVRCKPDGW
jgi:hypothetical protein